MDLSDKLKILSGAAKYDVSCASNVSIRENQKFGISNSSVSGICHSWTDDGRCVSLLKILLTNYCIYDCTYCINKISNDIPRAIFTPDEICNLTINFYKRNYIEGLFLSSGIIKNPNYTMELMLKTIKKLRNEYNFNGYIHLKIIPGTDLKLVKEAGFYADRVSINIELPNNENLKKLAPQKKKEDILLPMSYIHTKITETREIKQLKKYKPLPIFAPAGQSTQMIIGATQDSDLDILNLSQNLYKKYDLKRVYYSAYVPVNRHPALPNNNPPLLREHRLYQADWLIRIYGFDTKELLNYENPNLDLDLDPKSSWALRNLQLFPIEINTADYEMLIRVPGIGIKSAKKIIMARKKGYLCYEDLRNFGIVLKRAKNFITCNGKYHGIKHLYPETIKGFLISENIKKKYIGQLSFFQMNNPGLVMEELL